MKATFSQRTRPRRLSMFKAKVSQQRRPSAHGRDMGNTTNFACESSRRHSCLANSIRVQTTNALRELLRRAVHIVLVGVLFPTILLGQDTPDYFRQNCMSCHTIGGGRLTGPDLKGITERQQPNREWLIDFMMNPKAVIDSGDAHARKIFDESGGVVIMPTPPGMTQERAENVLDLIAAESKLEESQFKGLQISNKPFTDVDRDQGRAIFLGRQRLAGGGTSCISCHSMHDTSALGGGRLGPELTNVYERLKGRKSLAAWLMAPGTETMQPVFKDKPMTNDEIHALTAYFESAAGESPSEPSASRVALLLMGLMGAGAFVFGFDAIWKRRFHSVRQPLVDASPRTSH